MTPEELEQQKTKIISIRLLIEGRVQKVGFREWMKKAATKARVNGWVRNRSDETVEALLVGEHDAVRELIQQCHIGPAMASVKRIREFPVSSSNVGKGFQTLV